MKSRMHLLTIALIATLLVSSCSNLSSSSKYSTMSNELFEIQSQSEYVVLVSRENLSEFVDAYLLDTLESLENFDVEEYISAGQIDPEDREETEAELADYLSYVQSDEAAEEIKNSTSEITPDYVANHSDYRVFISSLHSYLLFQGEIYFLEGSGFFPHVIDMKLADIDGDDQYELYYTFHGGSMVTRSSAGFFDPVNKEATVFQYANFSSDLMWIANKDGSLSLREAIQDQQYDQNYELENYRYKLYGPAPDVIATVTMTADGIQLISPDGALPEILPFDPEDRYGGSFEAEYDD
jgi:hypothetical protein